MMMITAMKQPSSSTVTIFRDENQSEEEYQPLIPGLPDEIAEHCLLHLPYPYQSLVRSVSSSWNRALTSPNFLISKKTLSLSLPYIFVFAFHKSTSQIQWQSFDPRSNRWFVLPPMPCPRPVCPPGFACAAVAGRASLYVLGGMRSDTESPLRTLNIYNAAKNEWSEARPMITPRSFFSAGTINGKIFAAGGTGVGIQDTGSMMECYNPENDTWTPVAKMRSGLARYDAAVLGNKMYVTEGWTWPFSFSPRGGVYDSETDTWQDMRVGMREGWTGISVVLDDRLFVITEHCNCRLKVYIPEDDTWMYVGGGRFPCETVQRPFSVSAVDGRIYVVAGGLRVAVGTVSGEGRTLNVDWEVVESPEAFRELVPLSSHVLYS